MMSVRTCAVHRKLLASLLLLLILLPGAKAQSVDSLDHRMQQYGARAGADLLFVHTDKHIYTNNEFLWFSAYLLHSSADSLALHHFLNVTLIQAGTREAAVHQKFFMENGHSEGSLQLPDSIPPGEYRLLAYTNLLGSDTLPLAVFTQSLQVRSLHKPDFGAFLNTMEDSLGNKNLEITVREKGSGRAIRDADLLVWTGSNKAIGAKTDKLGSYRSRIPAVAINSTPGLIINARVKYNGDMVFLQKTLIAVKDTPQLLLHFFPEGGHLLARVPCRVAWESVTRQGEPLAVKALLRRDGIPLDTVMTNEQGLGSFLLIPEKDARYTMEPLKLPAGVVTSSPAFSLPAVLPQGMSLSVPAAIAGDTVRVRLYAQGYTKVRMVVHNFQQVFVTEDIETRPAGRDVVLLLTDIPRGLAAITLLDSMDRPFAERIFFAHYNRKVQAEASVDRPRYGKREMVTLTLHVRDTSLTAALASVACAQANRFDARRQQDIETFDLLQSALQAMPAYTTGRAFDDRLFLEMVLLVRGWRAYSWRDMFDKAPLPQFYTPGMAGQVVGINRKIRKPVTLTLLNGASSMHLITSDSSGHFKLPYDQLLIGQDKKFWLASTAGNTAENYVEIFDPYAGVNRKMAAGMDFRVADPDRFSQSSQELVLQDFPGRTMLAAVTVRVRKDDVIYGAANKCGDYVCPYNILNCPNHPGNPGNHLPERGRQYNAPGGGQTTYWGCTLEEEHKNAIVQLDGVKIGKAFYGEDFSKKTDSLPEYISTLYWSPRLVFSADGKAECSFYTSDITGLFRVVVNGITNNNLFYTTTTFEVR